MSSSMTVEVRYSSDFKINVDEKAEVCSLSDKAGYSLNDMRNLFEDGWAELSGYADEMCQLVSYIAKLYPEVNFMLRCCGEDLSDTALRRFDGGQVVFAVGPWNN